MAEETVTTDEPTLGKSKTTGAAGAKRRESALAAANKATRAREEAEEAVAVAKAAEGEAWADAHEESPQAPLADCVKQVHDDSRREAAERERDREALRNFTESARAAAGGKK